MFQTETFEELPSENSKLQIKTSIERTDIAFGHRVYQSSIVDNKSADFAITPPYEQFSKTRREADPWWEIDFSRSYHVHSLSFSIATGIRQNLVINVILLNKPFGFENPFLDEIVKQSIVFKEFPIKESSKSKMIKIQWELPANSTCFAIRIQSRGVHSLVIQKFQAMQGDDLVSMTEDDLLVTANSFATLGPLSIKQSLAEMVSPAKKKEMMIANYPIKEKRVFNENDVNDLSTNIQGQYNKLQDWKVRVLGVCSIFNEDEIKAFYHNIFKYTADLDYNNKSFVLDENELLDSALIQHHPRCDLTELHTRLRSIVRWVQTRTQLKLLGELANSTSFDGVANNPNDHLYHLLSAFKRVEYYWDKKEKMIKNRINELNSKDKLLVPPSVAEARGCSWSQFLIIIGLFCTSNSFRIPLLAFNISDERATKSPGSDDESSSSKSFNSRQFKTVSSFSIHTSSIFSIDLATLIKMSQERPMTSVLSRQKTLPEIENKKEWLNDLSKSKSAFKFEEFREKTLNLNEIAK